MSALLNVAIRDVIDVVCEHFKVTLLDLRSARRTAEIVEPRHWVCYLAGRLTEKGYSQIGNAICRDHSSVMAARDKISARVKEDGAAAALAEELEIAVLALAQLRRPGALIPRVEEAPLAVHDIARRIIKGGRRAAMNASVEDVIGLCQALLATPEPLLITDKETEQETAANV